MQEFKSPKVVSLKGVGEHGADSRSGLGYRTVQVGDPAYGVKLEIARNSPLYESQISDIGLEIEADRVDPERPAAYEREKEEHTRSISRRFNIIKTCMLGICLLGAACLAYSTVSFYKHKNEFYKHKNEIRQNLEPNAVYFRSNLFGYTGRDFVVAGINKDVDGNGKYESVLRFRNPVTDQMEERLIENIGGQLKIRRFEVVEGRIVYMPE